MTDFEDISLRLKSPLLSVRFEASTYQEGHLLIETQDESDAFILLFELDGAKLG